MKTFFDKKTCNATHLVCDPDSSACALIDTVMDFDAASGRTGFDHADSILAFVEAENLSVEWVLETHIHADHLTAATYIAERTGARTAIGSDVVQVQKNFTNIYNLGDSVPADGSQFDHLFADGEEFAIGGMTARVIATPGHTPDCVTYVIGDSVFCGDTFFMPDSGTARCDFPGGSAEGLYQSLQQILSLPDETRLFVNHDYGAGGKRDCAWETTVAEQRQTNIHIGGGVTKAEFVKMREERDATLSMPALMLAAIQINMRAGGLPDPEGNGSSYLKIPLNGF